MGHVPRRSRKDYTEVYTIRLRELKKLDAEKAAAKKKKKSADMMSVIAEKHNYETVLFIGTEKIAVKNLLAEVVIRGLRSIGVEVKE